MTQVRKRIVGLLSPDDYAKLEQLAQDQDRVIDQQVTHMVRQALAKTVQSLHEQPTDEMAVA
jgi:hypothetical protein